MPVMLVQNLNEIVQLSIQSEFSIYTVLQDKQQLMTYLKNAREIHINLAGITEIDGAGVQLLIYAKQFAISRNITLSLAEHSQVVLDAFELLNLVNYFGDPVVISADRKTT